MVGGGTGDLDALAGVERAEAMVRATRALLGEVESGGVPAEDADVLVSALVGMIASVESSLHALAARRAALVGLVSAVVRAFPATMVPLAPGERPSASDHEHARRALVADLATSTGASEATTATAMETATELTCRLPGVLAAMGAGLLGDLHVRRVVRHSEDLPDEAVGAFEAGVLARVPADRTPAGVGRAARVVRDRLHPESRQDRHRRAVLERTVRLDPAPDGMAWLSAFLPAVQAGAIHDRLTRMARRMGEDPEERRTLAQRRADALTALALDVPPDEALRPSVPLGSRTGPMPCEPGLPALGMGVPSTSDAAVPDPALREPGLPELGGGEPGLPELGVGDPALRGPGAGDVRTGAGQAPPAWTLDPALRSIRPTVAVTVPVLTLLGLDDEPAELEGYGPIDADTARVLAAQAPSFIRVLTHPETGAVLSVGRDRYTVPADLRTWVRLRDGTCRFPGCHRPATGCDVDHTVPFHEGSRCGETAEDNLAHLCRTHHRLKHTSRWRVSRQPDAGLTWTSPTGSRHSSLPARSTGTDGAARTRGSPGDDSGSAPGRQSHAGESPSSTATPDADHDP